jgi:mannose-6-phosphate isomerase-like protein (cupin superfamily)
VPRQGQELGSDAFRVRFAQIDEELLVMEASYGGDGNLPPEHLHPRQLERFEVLEGAVRAIVDGVERRHGKGDRFEVPAGAPHQMTGDGPARVHWEVRPALRTAEFFETLLTGRAGPDFLAEFSQEIQFTTT